MEALFQKGNLQEDLTKKIVAIFDELWSRSFVCWYTTILCMPLSWPWADLSRCGRWLLWILLFFIFCILDVCPLQNEYCRWVFYIEVEYPLISPSHPHSQSNCHTLWQWEACRLNQAYRILTNSTDEIEGMRVHHYYFSCPKCGGSLGCWARENGIANKVQCLCFFFLWLCDFSLNPYDDSGMYVAKIKMLVHWFGIAHSQWSRFWPCNKKEEGSRTKKNDSNWISLIGHNSQ